MIKTVCAVALDGDDQVAMALYRDLANPDSDLEMAGIIETLLARRE